MTSLSWLRSLEHPPPLLHMCVKLNGAKEWSCKLRRVSEEFSSMEYLSNDERWGEKALWAALGSGRGARVEGCYIGHDQRHKPFPLVNFSKPIQRWLQHTTAEEMCPVGAPKVLQIKIFLLNWQIWLDYDHSVWVTTRLKRFISVHFYSLKD